MSFGVGLVLYILGSILVGVCLWCIPGKGSVPNAAAPQDRGHQ
jgi:hypothetical protein